MWHDVWSGEFVGIEKIMVTHDIEMSLLRPGVITQHKTKKETYTMYIWLCYH